MDSADLYLKRAVLGLSIALVLLLAGVAIYSLFSGEDSQSASPSTTAVDSEPAAPAGLFPGDRLQIGDREFPLSVGCLRDRIDAEVFYVIIENQGQTATDYLVSARLSSQDGEQAEALARADDLRPGEEREVVLLPESGIEDPVSCKIIAVQGDRRVLLSGG